MPYPKENITQRLQAKLAEIQARGLNTFPAGDAIETLGVEAFEFLFHALRSPFLIQHPHFELVLEIQTLIGPRIAWLICTGDYEHGDLELIQTYLQPGEKVLELGGGLGLTAALLAKRSGLPLVVVEPDQRLYPLIARQVNLNGGEVCFEFGAVSAKQTAEVLDLYLSRELWFSNIVAPAQHLETIQVPCLDLNLLLETYQPQVLVVDIEGAEMGLFSGSLRHYPSKILLEIHTPQLGEKASAQVISELQALGYQLKDFRGWTFYFERQTA